MRAYRTVNLVRAYWASALTYSDRFDDVVAIHRMLVDTPAWAGETFNSIIWC